MTPAKLFPDMKALTILFYAIALLLLLGCAQVGIPAPTTFNQRAAVVISTVTAVRSSTTTLLQAKKISADDAQNVQNSANAARTGVDVAISIAAADPVGANNKLTAVTTALTALQAYLATKGATK